MVTELYLQCIYSRYSVDSTLEQSDGSLKVPSAYHVGFSRSRPQFTVSDYHVGFSSSRPQFTVSDYHVGLHLVSNIFKIYFLKLQIDNQPLKSCW